MHVLNVEVWIILKVIVLRTKVLRMGKQAVPQEFVPGAEMATTGLGCSSLSQAGARKRGKGSAPDLNLLEENSLWGYKSASQPK